MEKLCFIGPNPNFLGGISLYQKNLCNYLQSKNPDSDLTWIYGGNENKIYEKEGINYIEIKIPKMDFLKEIIFNFKVLKYLKKNDFDVINSHAIWGHWIKFYKKIKDQKIIHTYHGTTYYFLKNSLKRFGFIKRLLLFPILAYGFLIEKPPIKKADKIICVSEKVKKQIQELYKIKRDIKTIRTGVNLEEFGIKDKNKAKKELGLNQKNFYGLYVGRGGYWTKGLDKAIELSKEIYNLNKNYRLIVGGSDFNKVKNLINEKFIIFLENIPRKDISNYYNSSDLFFCMSRYEGGAPTLVVSEAMASGCLVVCSKSAEQEIIKNEENGIIIEENYLKESKRILDILKDNKKMKEIIQNSLKTVKELSLEKWGKKYLEELK
jgi:glycosyltransferase involved in cell wall biosynthesis